MALELGEAAPGADVHRTLQVFGAAVGFICAVGGALVHVETSLYDGLQLRLGEPGELLRLYDAGDVGAHPAAPDDVAPARVHAVAALDAEEGYRKLYQLGQPGDGGVHIAGAAAVCAVALRGDGDRAALPCDADAVFDGSDVRGLLFYGYRRDQPAQQRRYPAV